MDQNNTKPQAMIIVDTLVFRKLQTPDSLKEYTPRNFHTDDQYSGARIVLISKEGDMNIELESQVGTDAYLCLALGVDVDHPNGYMDTQFIWNKMKQLGAR